MFEVSGIFTANFVTSMQPISGTPATIPPKAPTEDRSIGYSTPQPPISNKGSASLDSLGGGKVL